MVWRIRGPFKVMPWRKVILHEARRKAAKVVRRRGLVEGRRLLVGWERSAEVRRALHAERRFPLVPPRRRLILLVVPRRLIVLAAPRGRGLVLSAPGAFPRATPAGVSLFVPHALVAVPWRAWGRGLSGVKRWLEASKMLCLVTVHSLHNF